MPKSTKSHEQSNHSFQTPNSLPQQVYDVSGVPHNTFFGKIALNSVGIKGLKIYMKCYVSKLPYDLNICLFIINFILYI